MTDQTDSRALQCTARSKGTGERCRNYPTVGLKVCRFHGGASKAARAAGKRRVKQRQIKFKAGQMATALLEANVEEGNPTEGVLEACRRSGALMRVFGGLVGELDLKPNFEMRLLPDGTEVAQPSGLEGFNRHGEQAINVLLQQYRSAIDQYARVCKLALDAGIAAAHVRIEAQKAQMLATVIQRVLTDLKLSPEQRAIAPTLVRRHLLQLDEAASPKNGVQADA